MNRFSLRMPAFRLIHFIRDKRYQIGIAVVTMCAAFFLFANLGDRILWSDEAQTALLARQITKSGIPKFNVGENIPTDSPDFSDFNRDGVFIWNTWLPYYLTAISFQFLGESEFAARLPFAIFGALTLLLYYKFTLKLFHDRKTILISMFLLCLSIPFFLHMRQCRYFAIAVFGTLWMIWGYLSLGDGKKSGIIHIAAAGLLCFHSFYINAFLNLACLLTHAFLFRRRSIIRGLLIAGAIVLVFSLPAVVYMGMSGQTLSPEATTPQKVSRSLWVYTLWINGFLFPYALPVFASALRKTKGRGFLFIAYILFLAGAAMNVFLTQSIIMFFISLLLIVYYLYSGKDYTPGSSGLEQLFSLLLIFVPSYITVFAFFAPYPFYRYITPLMPLFFPFSAFLLSTILQKGRFLGYTVLFLLVTTNILSVLPLKLSEILFPAPAGIRKEYTVSPRDIWRWTDLRTDIAAFFDELTHSVADPEKGLVDYFRKYGKPGQIIKASYDDLSLMFYLPHMRIIPRLVRGGVPDYIIPRGEYPLLFDNNFLQLLEERKVIYREEAIPYPDVVWGNNPDPLFHLYNMPSNKQSIKIYKRLSF